MDVPARADSDPRRFQAAGDGLWPGWPPVKSHDGAEDRLMGGGREGEESHPCKCLHLATPDTEAADRRE